MLIDCNFSFKHTSCHASHPRVLPFAFRRDMANTVMGRWLQWPMIWRGFVIMSVPVTIWPHMTSSLNEIIIHNITAQLKVKQHGYHYYNLIWWNYLNVCSTVGALPVRMPSQTADNMTFGLILQNPGMNSAFIKMTSVTHLKKFFKLSNGLLE